MASSSAAEIFSSGSLLIFCQQAAERLAFSRSMFGGNRRQLQFIGRARDHMDRRIRIEIEVDARLARHQGLDLQLRAQAALHQLIDVGLAALAADDLKFLGVELDIDGNPELLLPDVILNDDLGDGADLDSRET